VQRSSQPERLCNWHHNRQLRLCSGRARATSYTGRPEKFTDHGVAIVTLSLSQRLLSTNPNEDSRKDCSTLLCSRTSKLGTGSRDRRAYTLETLRPTLDHRSSPRRDRERLSPQDCEADFEYRYFTRLFQYMCEPVPFRIPLRL